ncbi:MAG: DUF2851 family protein [Verrucomicrobiae bacterium]|nr:DUF2851 family protein [Verrucomicrobiae bacterium]
MTIPADLYRQWRTQGGSALALAERRPCGAPPERWLQEVWAHQRIRRASLQTTDGQPLVILHPGFWNREAGPDFLRAILQRGTQPPVSGDIEIDLASSGWKSHGHAGNAAYRNVILHVVWDPPAHPAPLPTLVLRDLLDAPLDELESWVGGASDPSSAWLAGHCSAPLAELPAPALADLLRQAGLVRLQIKALLFRARARAAGWQQALWEGLFRALGYKHNAWPMQRLAEILPLTLDHPVDPNLTREAWEARLLGLSGLLPAEPKAGTYSRRLWDLWWRDRGPFDSALLPARLWRLNGVRPVNHPQRRLAIAASWVADPSWIARLESWFLARPLHPHAERSLAEAVRPDPHRFWRRHCTLTARELPQPLPLLGAGRLNDIAVNAILPWFWARADAGGRTADLDYLSALYLNWSAGEDNAVLKLARSRLLAEAPPFRTSAATQQGLLQIVSDFCSHSNALCDQCPFPRWIRSLADPAPPA